MKQTIVILAMLAALSLVGCSKKNSNNPVAPNPAPQQANVAFSMHLESGTQGMIFVAKPNVDVKLTKVELRLPAQNFSDTLNNPNPNEVFPKDSNIQLNEYTGVDAGQQWVLKFYGIVASTGQAFTITVNWTVV